VETPSKRSTSKSAAGHEQQAFEGMSKAELLARAKELEVTTNAKMTKLQLVEALTDAEAPPSKRRRRVS
jgi:hypothetical protein